MPYSATRLQEELSLAYLHAIATAAGFAIQREMVDEDSIDVTVCARGPIGRRVSPRFLAQAKCTFEQTPVNDRLKYPLKIKNYNELRETNVTIPRVLIVLHVPRENAERVHWTPESLRLRNCAYWRSLKGMPPTANPTKKTVVLDRALSIEELQRIMLLVAEGEL